MVKKIDKEISYEALSEERKKLQSEGSLPDWYITGGWQMFKQKYLYGVSTYKEQIERIAKTAAQYTDNVEFYEKTFFDMIWNGWLSLSTPVLSNCGTNRGMPVSCSGNTVEDSVDGFYKSRHEVAILSQNGFGTSSYLGNIRHRGAKISRGGTASGILPVLLGHVQDSRDINQGSRRGAWAGYVPVEHNDFDEVVKILETEPDDINIGWNITDSFVEKLKNGDEEANRRYKRMLMVKVTTGKGYFCFIDKINRNNPPAYKNNNLTVKASNLCDEITLFADENHSFICVLSSLNLFKYDEWKDSDFIKWATVFLDCINSDFIEKSKNIPKLDKVRASAIKGRSLGLGVCGFHSYLQSKMIPFESYEANSFNNLFFKEMREKSYEASRELALKYGEPEWCIGTGMRNTHTMAIAPTMSSALLVGGISQGIEPVMGNAFTQDSAAGEIERVNPILLPIMIERGVYSKKVIDDIASKVGSVQHVDWLSEHEKKVFKTAFEIDQRVILRYASSRGKYVDQWQSLNLFFDANEKEEYISSIHKEAFLDEGIRGLYYMRTQKGVMASKDTCESCV